MSYPYALTMWVNELRIGTSIAASPLTKVPHAVASAGGADRKWYVFDHSSVASPRYVNRLTIVTPVSAPTNRMLSRGTVGPQVQNETSLRSATVLIAPPCKSPPTGLDAPHEARSSRG